MYSISLTTKFGIIIFVIILFIFKVSIRAGGMEPFLEKIYSPFAREPEPSMQCIYLKVRFVLNYLFREIVTLMLPKGFHGSWREFQNLQNLNGYPFMNIRAFPSQLVFSDRYCARLVI